MNLVIRGEPTAKGSLTAIVRGGKAALIPGGSYARRDKIKAWGVAVGSAIEAWVLTHPGFVPIDEPCAVRVCFFVPRPKSVKPAVRYAPKRPDLDKYLRALLDLLQPRILADDARVVYITAAKEYATTEGPGAVVAVTALSEALDA
jgi:Holliday junction resolvase RusA-like endonuclease